MLHSDNNTPRGIKGAYFPLKLAVAYILGTLLLSVVGPIVYFNGAYKKSLSVLYVGAVLIFMTAGYYFGLHIKSNNPVYANEDYGKQKIMKLLRLSQNVAFVSIGLEFLYLIVTGKFSLNLSNVGATYVNIDRAGSANIIIIFRFCTAFFRTAAVALGFYYFKDSSGLIKKKTLLCAIGIFAIYLFGYGTQSGIGYIFIELLVAISANMIKDGSRLSRKTIRRIIIIGVALLFLFAYMQYMRYSLMGINAHNYHIHSTGEYGFNTDHFIFKIFGEDLGFGLSSIFGGYMSLGYYGLSLCLQLPFEWTYGIGNSYALMQLLSKFGIKGVLEKTYLLRMQSHYGRNGLTAWNTIFPWLASDLTWVGTLFMFFVIGATIAYTWKDILLHRNAFSFLLFTMLMILVFFIPANNAIVHGYDNLMSTNFIVCGWIFLRKRYMYE